jgi:hypothetical protein
VLPTFFIIGAAKSGTTSLAYYLGLHPEIHMSPVKEPHFFAGPENGLPYPKSRVDRLEDYERLFETDLLVRGEASPSYSQYARRTGVPARIKESVPDAKLVYIVRDPIARTISHYGHWSATGERRSLRDSLADAESLTNIYTCGGRYATQLEQYLQVFPQEQILVLDQHELRRDRAATLRKTYAFLDVDPSFTSVDFDRQLGTREEHRSYGSRYAQLRQRVSMGALSRLPKPLRRQMRRGVEAVESKVLPPVEPPTLDEDMRERLLELYRPEVERLRALTGEPFASWSL